MKIACAGLLLGSFAATVSAQTVSEVVGNSTEHATLYAALEAAGLLELLGSEEVTLFAPQDDAFAALDAAVVEALLTPPYLSHLQFLLSQHVVAETVFASNITADTTLEALAGPLSFYTTDEGVFVGGSGFNESQIVQADIAATNGVVHVVDQVFIPIELIQTTWDNLQDVPEGFEVLKTFLEETGLDVALSGSEPLTIFAPSDAVFAGVSAEDLATLNVTEVLYNHALMGIYPSSMLTDGMVVTTLLGVNYTVTVDGETVLIGGIPVTQANLVSSNGITHVIGGILLPPVEGEAPVAPPTLAPVAAPGDSTPMPSAGAGTVFTDAPTSMRSSASKVGSLMTLACVAVATFLW